MANMGSSSENVTAEWANGELHELVITRVFEAPRELVWRAWTDPEMAKQWQAPKTFTVPHLEHDLRPGGRWRKCMSGRPPGADTLVEMWQSGMYREVKPPEQPVFTYAWERRASVGLTEDGEPHETIVTIRLEEENGRTTMHFHQAPFATAQERDGHNGGWSSGFERLAELVRAR